MAEPDHLISEIRDLRNQVEAQAAQLESLKKSILDNTAVMVHGQTYWPEWVGQVLGSLPGGVNG